MLQQIRHVLESLAPRHAPLDKLAPRDAELIRRIRGRKLTHLSERKLAGLARSCREIEDKRLPGVLIEAGIALGGSTILLASLKQDARPLRAHDVFHRVAPPAADDPPEVHARYRAIRAGRPHGLDDDGELADDDESDDRYARVQAHLRDFGIDPGRQQLTLVQGLVQDTLAVMEPVALAHIDLDWHEPVKVCLERIFPWLVPGGCIVLDAYHDWGGCRRATDDYLPRVAGRYILDDGSGALKITRLAH